MLWAYVLVGCCSFLAGVLTVIVLMAYSNPRS